MNRARFGIAGILTATVLAACSARGPRSPWVAERCPLPANAVGYPVTAHSPSGRLDSASLTTIARAVISRWDPGDSLAFAPQVRALSRQLAQKHAAFRDDWLPSSGDTATLTVVLGSLRPVLAEPNGTADPTPFQRRAWQAAHRLREGLALMDTSLESLLPGAEVSTVVLRFGREPGSGDGVARFTVHERPAGVNRATLRTEYPEAARQLAVEASVRLAFIIDANGRVDTSRVRVLSAPYREFVDAAKAAVGRGKFTAAMADCQPVPQVAVQEFNFKLIR